MLRRHRRGPPAAGRVGEHARFPIARLRYTKPTGLWAISWRDCHLKLHERRHSSLRSFGRTVRRACSPLVAHRRRAQRHRFGQTSRPGLPDRAPRGRALGGCRHLDRATGGPHEAHPRQRREPTGGPLARDPHGSDRPEALAEEFLRIGGIESAFLYGSFAARMLRDTGPAPHDIDVMVFGEPDVDAVYEACARIEAAVHVP